MRKLLTTILTVGLLAVPGVALATGGRQLPPQVCEKNPSQHHNPHCKPKECPKGSYEIDKDKHGNPICKEEPKDCPYNEAFPKDHPKCVKPEEPVQPETPKVETTAPVVEQPVVSNPVVTESWGK